MIRPFEGKDLAVFKRLHAEMGLDYDLPDKFFSLVMANANDEPEQALLFRPTAEMFFLRKQVGTPLERWEKFQRLHEAARRMALDLGLTEVEAFLPPVLEKRFGQRLMSLGWEKNLWPAYTRILEA